MAEWWETVPKDVYLSGAVSGMATAHESFFYNSPKQEGPPDIVVESAREYRWRHKKFGHIIWTDSNEHGEEWDLIGYRDKKKEDL